MFSFERAMLANCPPPGPKSSGDIKGLPCPQLSIARKEAKKASPPTQRA